MSNDRRIAVAILNRSAAVVGKERGQQHGDTEDSFRLIGEMWGTYIRHVMRVKTGMDIMVSFSPVDVANMMADVKRARSIYGDPQAPDHYVDQIGYSALAGMLALAGIPEAPAAPADGQVVDGQQDGNTGEEGTPIPAFLKRGPVSQDDPQKGGE
jgi:hypothetical protein